LKDIIESCSDDTVVNNNIFLKKQGPSASVMRLDACSNKLDQRRSPVIDFLRHSYINLAFWRAGVNASRACSFENSFGNVVMCSQEVMCTICKDAVGSDIIPFDFGCANAEA
jgi:hypothetical protein